MADIIVQDVGCSELNTRQCVDSRLEIPQLLRESRIFTFNGGKSILAPVAPLKQV